jgi:hypothetical protein
LVKFGQTHKEGVKVFLADQEQMVLYVFNSILTATRRSIALLTESSVRLEFSCDCNLHCSWNTSNLVILWRKAAYTLKGMLNPIQLEDVLHSTLGALKLGAEEIYITF